MSTIGRPTLAFDKQATEEARKKRQKTLTDFFVPKKESDQSPPEKIPAPIPIEWKPDSPLDEIAPKVHMGVKRVF